MKPTLAFLALLMVTPACGGGESVSSMLDEYVGQIDTQVDILCDCWNDWNYTSREECTGTFGILPSTRRCIEDALNQDSEAAMDWLRCINNLESEYTACVDARLACDDLNSLDSCDEDYNLGYGECIGLPGNVQRDLDNCSGDAGAPVSLPPVNG